MEGQKNLMHNIPRKSPQEAQIFNLSPMVEPPLVDLNLSLSLGGAHVVKPRNPSINVLPPPPPQLSPFAGTVMTNTIRYGSSSSPPLTVADKIRAKLPPLLPSQLRDDNVKEILPFLKMQKRWGIEEKTRIILQKRAEEHVEGKRHPMASVGGQSSLPLQLRPPEPPKERFLLKVGAAPTVTSCAEGPTLHGVLEQMKTPGQFSEKKAPQGATIKFGTGDTDSTGSNQPTPLQENRESVPNVGLANQGNRKRAAVAAAIANNLVIDLDDELIEHPPKMVKCLPVNALTFPESAHSGNNNNNKTKLDEQERMMISVSATGKGPNGRKVNGFLYSCNNIGQVILVCACHGLFLNPEDFMLHAGETNLVEPMKCIQVCGLRRFPF